MREKENLTRSHVKHCFNKSQQANNNKKKKKKYLAKFRDDNNDYF